MASAAQAERCASHAQRSSCTAVSQCTRRRADSPAACWDWQLTMRAGSCNSKVRKQLSRSLRFASAGLSDAWSQSSPSASSKQPTSLAAATAACTATQRQRSTMRALIRARTGTDGICEQWSCAVPILHSKQWTCTFRFVSLIICSKFLQNGEGCLLYSRSISRGTTYKLAAVQKGKTARAAATSNGKERADGEKAKRCSAVRARASLHRLSSPPETDSRPVAARTIAARTAAVAARPPAAAAAAAFAAPAAWSD